MNSAAFFPTTADIGNYLRDYAEHFQLTPHVRLRHEVVSTRQQSDSKWLVRYRNVETGKEDEDIFDFLLITAGSYTKPNIPEQFRKVLAEGSFTGSMYHSIEFQRLFPLNQPSPLAGKEVLKPLCTISKY